ncbi:hypothetical protein M5K25_023745 [Dendrobium thyrsiflorum]|uniref:Uncharacterized protein n=1 Tax=Dendrobium thyrsiflorum TaxID=117978 RepID=A0ABD0U055_DENTH
MPSSGMVVLGANNEKSSNTNLLDICGQQLCKFWRVGSKLIHAEIFGQQPGTSGQQLRRSGQQLFDFGRFVFCRSVLALYNLTFHQEEFLPSCLPDLPDCLHPESALSESVVLALANFFGVNGHFIFSKGTKVPELMADHRHLVSISCMNRLQIFMSCIQKKYE